MSQLIDTQPKLGEMVGTITDRFLELAQHRGHQAFQDKQFRGQFQWSKLEEEEQNRLFNELVVTAIGFVYLRLDDELVMQDAMPFVTALRNEFVPQYKIQLTEMGIPSTFVKQWIKLLNLRLKEYRKDIEDFGPDVRLQLAEVVVDEPLLAKQVYTRVLVVALAALSHLRCGKFDEHDQLLPYLKRWLIGLDRELAPALEPLTGGIDE